jgi:hypothetical protein
MKRMTQKKSTRTKKMNLSSIQAPSCSNIRPGLPTCTAIRSGVSIGSLTIPDS